MAYSVTIGIPVYQVESCVRRTMESALAQDYPDIEFLVVDDGCTDNSIDIVRELQATHPRGRSIRIVTHETNLGVSAARNRIIDEARGECLYFMDSDDVIAGNTISLLLGELRRHDADIVFGSYEKISQDGKRMVFQYPDKSIEAEDQLANYAYRKYAGIQASACNYLVRMSVLRRHQLRFFKSNFWEDTVFTLELVTIVRRAVLMSDITYTYIVRQNSLSNSQGAAKLDKAGITAFFEAIETLKRSDGRLERKAYYPDRCYVAVMSDFYIICNILKKWNDIQPSFTTGELHAFLRHPATLRQIMGFRKRRAENLLLFALGKLPATWSLLLIRLAAKYKRLL